MGIGREVFGRNLEEVQDKFMKLREEAVKRGTEVIGWTVTSDYTDPNKLQHVNGKQVEPHVTGRLKTKEGS